jgi:hypothetical protein
MNINKIQNGFIKDEKEYLFEEFDGQLYEIVSDSQVHIGTNDGVMLLDLSVTIDEQSFSDLNDFVNQLYSLS